MRCKVKDIILSDNHTLKYQKDKKDTSIWGEFIFSLYPFIVLDANQTPMGAVTVYARKRSATPIYRVTKHVGNYGVTSKSGADQMLFSDIQGERYWELIDQCQDEVRAFPDHSIASKGFPPKDDIMGEGGGGGGGYTPAYLHFDNDGAEMFWIREYAAKFKNYTWVGGFCGPWVAGYILSTLYENDIRPDLFDKEGYTVQGGGIRGAMTAPCLNFALSDYSQGKITIGMNGLSHYDAYWHVREKQAVARLLINWPIHNGYHWTVLYGCYRVNRALTTNYYFMQADNGALVSTDYRSQRNERVFESYSEIQWFDTLFPIWGHK